MKKIIVVLGFMALGAALWAAFGDEVTNKACETKSEVQAEVHNKAKNIVDSIAP